MFFAALFGVEMLLKVFGHGFYGYIQDGFNVFDGFIVLLRYQIITLLFMAALCNGGIIFLPCDFYLSIYLSSFFSSPNLSGRRLDVCHTSTHGVALVRI